VLSGEKKMTKSIQNTSNLSPIIQIALNQKKITNLTDIQEKAIPFLFSKRNLVIVAPGGTGKTLLAELIMLNDFLYKQEFKSLSKEKLQTITFDHLNIKIDPLANHRKLVILVPLRALAEEKARVILRDYRKIKLDVHTSISDIDYNEKEITNCHVLISTFERFNTIISRKPEILMMINTVVIDEFHVLADEKRGTTLETIITILKRKSKRLILLSATVSNPEIVATWIDGLLIVSKKRLIPLKYQIIPTLRPIHQLKKIIRKNIKNENQTLVFSGTRKRAEELAEELQEFIFKEIKQYCNPMIGKSLAILESIPLIRNSPGNQKIYQLVEKSTAFHHAGLSRSARGAIEKLYKLRLVPVLFCTETLGAGINLPAREVVIIDPKRWNNQFLSRNIFHQIAGRAGRPDFDLAGLCTIFTNDEQEANLLKQHFFHHKRRPFLDFYTSILEDDIINPKFEPIESSIQTKPLILKTILNLIRNCQPTKKELINLLYQSYWGFSIKQKIKEKKKRNNQIGQEKEFETAEICQRFFRFLLEPVSKFNQKEEAVFEAIYADNELNLDDCFIGEENQTIIINNNGYQGFTVSINQYGLKCACHPDLFFCKHRWFVIKNLFKRDQIEALNNHFNLLQKLLRENFIIETAQEELRTTTKGTICAEMGTTIERFNYIKDWLKNSLFPKKVRLKQLLYSCNRLIQQQDGQINPLPQPIDDQPLYEHVILGKNLESIVTKHQLYEGDLLRTELSIKDLLTNLEILSNFLGMTACSKNITNLNQLVTESLNLTY
jgi:superfamily II DNA/RNA helicase